MSVQEARGRIDPSHAFFSVHRDFWRFTKDEMYVDVYIEGIIWMHYLDISSISHWRSGKLEKFEFAGLGSTENVIREISDDERDFIVLKISEFFRKRWSRVKCFNGRSATDKV
jgi:hypothetical protein